MTIREIRHGSPDYFRALAFRDALLRRPLGRAYSESDIAAEAGERHFIAEDEGGNIAGCASLAEIDAATAKMRQVAVAADRQRQGIGRLLAAAAENAAREAGKSRLVLHARRTAEDFYLALGYAVEGEEFTEVGLPHVRMARAL